MTCIGIAGRTNTEEGRDGAVCDSAGYFMLHHDILLLILKELLL
ncbi:hypothetical protein Gotur_010362 [Gossypium turneri]